MRLTKQSGHAIRILIDCAQSNGQLVKVADVSARLGITKQNVFKIVHLLSRTGFVAAVRGPNGGVHWIVVPGERKDHHGGSGVSGPARYPHRD